MSKFQTKYYVADPHKKEMPEKEQFDTFLLATQDNKFAPLYDDVRRVELWEIYFSNLDTGSGGCLDIPVFIMADGEDYPTYENQETQLINFLSEYGHKKLYFTLRKNTAGVWILFLYLGESPWEKTGSLMHKLDATKFTMPFGKHKGVTLSEIPKDYLTWLVKNITPETTLITKIKAYLERCKDEEFIAKRIADNNSPQPMP